MSLNKNLQELHKEVLDSLPADISKDIIIENQKLFSNFLYEKALSTGSAAPDVSFLNQNLEPVSLQSLLGKGHVVLSFFRGTWCPYCSLELKYLADIHKQITDRGAQLIAASPELYQFVEEDIKKQHIVYPIFTDLNNRVANEFGLVFELPPRYREIYQQLGIFLNVLHGDDKWILPVPATFIISKDGIIRATYVNADYTQRMEPEDILEELDKLAE